MSKSSGTRRSSHEGEPDVDAEVDRLSAQKASGADHVDIGFNEQQSGWGNVWSHNSVTNATVAGYSIRMQDGRFAMPTEDSSSFFVEMSCNSSVGSPTPAVDFQAGAIAHGSLAGNAFVTYMLNKRLTGYWASVEDTWNGSTTAPRTGVSSPTTTTC